MFPMSNPPKLSQMVATNVRAEMAAQKRTAAALAELLGVGYEAARSRVSGDVDISLNELERIADWLGVTVASLMAARSLAVPA
jgi:transcriptional regulator with XRE-family HTH domain